MEEGRAPADFEAMGAIVRAVSFDNARDYFGLI
jgi:hypothetical protein